MSETPNYNVERYPHGTVSWVECNSTDAATAKQFYSELLGWEIEDNPMSDTMMYTRFTQDGRYTAGLAPAQPNADGTTYPSHWMTYIAVDDADALADKVTELGGTVIFGPMDAFNYGRMLMIQDPTGAMVGLWQAKEHIGAGVVNKPGAMVWNELMTRDVEAAKAFYAGLLGWTYELDEASDYLMIVNGKRYNGGILPMGDEYGDMPAHWNVYFNVANVQATFDKAKSMGATLAEDKIHDAGAAGTFIIATEPSGSTAMFMQSDNVDAWDLETV